MILRSSRRHGYVVAALICAAAWSRLVPHWPNFTAVPAMAMFSGMVVGRRWLAFAAPLLAMLVSDLALAACVYGAAAFTMMPAVYAGIATTTWIGTRAPRSVTGVLIVGVAASGAFFVLVNFYVWLVSSLYPPTWSGLLACYVAALPFAANMLASTLVYGLALFGLWSLAARRAPAETSAA